MDRTLATVARPVRPVLSRRSRVALVGAPALAAAMLSWRYGPALAARPPWPRLLASAFMASAAWSCALAVVRGPGALSAPLAQQWEYLNDVPRVGAAAVAGFNWYEGLGLAAERVQVGVAVLLAALIRFWW